MRMRGARSPGCSRVSALWSARMAESQAHTLPGEPGSRSGEQARWGCKPPASRPHVGRPRLSPPAERSPGAWRPRAQSFPFRPEVSIPISSLHSRGNRAAVVPEQGTRWGLGPDASCRPATKIPSGGSPGRSLAHQEGKTQL